MTRVYLAIVGAAYVVLAFWCALEPERTARSVGFELRSGSGQSEYLVVYGGLQLALGLIFLWPLFRKQAAGYCLGVCVSIFALLVLFRTASFFLFDDFERTTYVLAAVEWLGLLAGLAVWRRK